MNDFNGKSERTFDRYSIYPRSNQTKSIWFWKHYEDEKKTWIIFSSKMLNKYPNQNLVCIKN